MREMHGPAENAETLVQRAEEHAVMSAAIEQEQNRGDRGERKGGDETVESAREHLERGQHALAQARAGDRRAAATRAIDRSR